MFENARHEVGRLDDVADRCSYAEVQTARRHFEPAIQLTSNLLTTKDYDLV
jgi:hypothetical protein